MTCALHVQDIDNIFQRVGRSYKYLNLYRITVQALEAN